jgi:hypothetical protein
MHLRHGDRKYDFSDLEGATDAEVQREIAEIRQERNRLTREVHTTGFDLPDRRMISAVPQPSAVARITLARHTCFRGALRSATIASSRRRSARVTLTAIPALIMRAWAASADLGIVRMNQTTSAVAP